jgi:arylsulfatase A
MTQPDILFVIFDDLWIGDVTPTLMPNATAFAATGGARTFTHCYSMPVCSQSRACMLYGKYGRNLSPPIIGGMDSSAGPEPDSDMETVATLLQDNGYQTCLVGKWHGGRNPFNASSLYVGAPQARGFQSWVAGTPDNIDDFYSWPRVDDEGAGVALTTETQYATAAQLAAAQGWWETADSSPRFMQVSFSAPHGPYNFPPTNELNGFVSTAHALNRQKYESEIRSVDWAFGELLATVGSDAVVVCVGDNGTPNNARAPGQQANKVKATCYEGGIRVPLAVRSPKYPSGTSDRLCHIVDIPATLLVAAGITVPSGWDGRSLTLSARTTALSEAQDGASGGGHLVRAAMTSQYKLLRTDSDPEELYNLLTDPTEVAPLSLTAPANASILATLREVLDG